MITGQVTPDREAVIRLRLRGPLVGVSLLYGHRLTVDVVDGGPVTLAPLR